MSYKSPAGLLFLEQKTLIHFIFPWSLAYATLRKYEWVIVNILGSPNEIKKPEACLRYMTINLLTQKPGREFPEAGKWPECKKSPLWFGVYGKSEGRCPGISDPINVQSSIGNSREMTRACLPSAAFLSRVRRFHLTWDTSDLNYFPWQGECISCFVDVIPLSSEEVLGLHRT